MKEAQLVNDRNLALQLAMDELSRIEPKRSENTGKIQGKNEKVEQKTTEFAMKQITIPVKGVTKKMILQSIGFQTQRSLIKGCVSGVMKNIHSAINARSEKKES